MFDAKAVIETKLVAQLQLAPQLFVTLMRRHSGLGPDVAEMREFHAGTLRGADHNNRKHRTPIVLDSRADQPGSCRTLEAAHRGRQYVLWYPQHDIGKENAERDG